MHTNCDQLITRKELARRFGGISRVTVWRWENDASKDFPQKIKIGQRVFFREEDVRNFIERHAGRVKAA